jgi:hypothetical protein
LTSKKKMTEGEIKLEQLKVTNDMAAMFPSFDSPYRRDGIRVSVDGRKVRLPLRQRLQENQDHGEGLPAFAAKVGDLVEVKLTKPFEECAGSSFTLPRRGRSRISTETIYLVRS